MQRRYELAILAAAAALVFLVGFVIARATVTGVPAHWRCDAFPSNTGVTCTRKDVNLL